MIAFMIRHPKPINDHKKFVRNFVETHLPFPVIKNVNFLKYYEIAKCTKLWQQQFS